MTPHPPNAPYAPDDRRARGAVRGVGRLIGGTKGREPVPWAAIERISCYGRASTAPALAASAVMLGAAFALTADRSGRGGGPIPVAPVSVVSVAVLALALILGAAAVVLAVARGADRERSTARTLVVCGAAIGALSALTLVFRTPAAVQWDREHHLILLVLSVTWLVVGIGLVAVGVRRRGDPRPLGNDARRHVLGVALEDLERRGRITRDQGRRAWQAPPGELARTMLGDQPPSPSSPSTPPSPPRNR